VQYTSAEVLGFAVAMMKYDSQLQPATAGWGRPRATADASGAALRSRGATGRGGAASRGQLGQRESLAPQLGAAPQARAAQPGRSGAQGAFVAGATAATEADIVAEANRSRVPRQFVNLIPHCRGDRKAP
jgi:hypothetical protein